jgi:hypothetical protein
MMVLSTPGSTWYSTAAAHKADIRTTEYLKSGNSQLGSRLSVELRMSLLYINNNGVDKIDISNALINKDSSWNEVG